MWAKEELLHKLTAQWYKVCDLTNYKPDHPEPNAKCTDKIYYNGRIHQKTNTPYFVWQKKIENNLTIDKIEKILRFFLKDEKLVNDMLDVFKMHFYPTKRKVAFAGTPPYVAQKDPELWERLLRIVEETSKEIVIINDKNGIPRPSPISLLVEYIYED